MKRILLSALALLPFQFLNAQNWVPLDNGIECFYPGSVVQKMTVDSSADKIFVSGGFTQDGNCIPMRGVAAWDGNKWDSIGDAAGNASKQGICVFKDTLYAFGNFSNTNNLFYWAKWTGTTWDSVSGIPNGPVMCYAERNDSLFLGGYFDHCGSDSTFLLGVYDGQHVASASQFCGDQGGFVISAMTFFNNTLYVGGYFSTWPSTPDFHNFGKWNGADSLLPVDPIFEQAPAFIDDMVVFQNELYISGRFLQQDGFPSSYIMKYDGQQFSAVGGGANERVSAMKVHNGELYIGGFFTQVGNVQSKYVAKWNGTQWFSLSTDSLTGYYPLIYDLDIYRDSLIISGNFRAINGDSSMQRIAKYNHALPTGIAEDPQNYSIQVTPNPANDQITFQFNANTGVHEIFIYDVTGKIQINVQSTDQHVSIAVDSLAAGVYFYSIYEDGNQLTGKIIVE